MRQQSRLAGARVRRSPPDRADPLAEFDYGAVELTAGRSSSSTTASTPPIWPSTTTACSGSIASAPVCPLRARRWAAGMAATALFPAIRWASTSPAWRASARTTGDAACAAKVGDSGGGLCRDSRRQEIRCFAGPNAEKVWPCYILDKHLAGLMDANSLSGVAQARELVPRVFHGALPYIPERGHDRVGKKDPPYDETYVLPESLFLAYEMTGERIILRPRDGLSARSRLLRSAGRAAGCFARAATHTATSLRSAPRARRGWCSAMKSICAR